MKTCQVYPKTEQLELPGHNLANEPLKTDHSEPENRMASGGSTQVLCDFFEFTDYLTPCSRILMKYRQSRQSVSEDFYSALLSF